MGLNCRFASTRPWALCYGTGPSGSYGICAVAMGARPPKMVHLASRWLVGSGPALDTQCPAPALFHRACDCGREQVWLASHRCYSGVLSWLLQYGASSSYDTRTMAMAGNVPEMGCLACRCLCPDEYTLGKWSAAKPVQVSIVANRDGGQRDAPHSLLHMVHRVVVQVAWPEQGLTAISTYLPTEYHDIAHVIVLVAWWDILMPPISPLTTGR